MLMNVGLSQTNSYYSDRNTDTIIGIGKSMDSVIHSRVINDTLIDTLIGIRFIRTVDTTYGSVVYMDSNGDLTTQKGFKLIVDNICDSCLLQESWYTYQYEYYTDKNGLLDYRQTTIKLDDTKWFYFIPSFNYQPFNNCKGDFRSMFSIPTHNLIK